MRHINYYFIDMMMRAYLSTQCRKDCLAPPFQDYDKAYLPATKPILAGRLKQHTGGKPVVGPKWAHVGYAARISSRQEMTGRCGVAVSMIGFFFLVCSNFTGRAMPAERQKGHFIFRSLAYSRFRLLNMMGRRLRRLRLMGRCGRFLHLPGTYYDGRPPHGKTC